MTAKAKITKQTSWLDLRDVLRDGAPFANSNRTFRGEAVTSPVPTGRLDAEHVATLRTADFVVFSYGTPIAWRTADGWVCPDERYSVTTSCHQGKLRPALANL